MCIIGALNLPNLLINIFQLPLGQVVHLGLPRGFPVGPTCSVSKITSWPFSVQRLDEPLMSELFQISKFKSINQISFLSFVSMMSSFQSLPRVHYNGWGIVAGLVYQEACILTRWAKMPDWKMVPQKRILGTERSAYQTHSGDLREHKQPHILGPQRCGGATGYREGKKPKHGFYVPAHV